MSTPAADRPDGAYFHRRDAAGFGRRVVADGVDLTVMVAAWVAYVLAYVVTWQINHPGPIVKNFMPPMWPWFLFCFLYLVPVKASRLRTLGYRLAGIRVVDLWGRRPSAGRMALRYMPWFTFGINGGAVDVLWTFSDPERRRLGDMLAGTCVVRGRAVPAGRGPVVLLRYDVNGTFFVFREVVRPA